MDDNRRFIRFKLRVIFMVVICLFPLNLKSSVCSTLNDEGLALLIFRQRLGRDPFGALWNWKMVEGLTDPCSWYGVECSDGKVVTLILKDLCLHGPLAPEIGKLAHIKSIILRNNSLSGEIPKELLKLEDLEVLDLGYNNFSGSFPSEIGNNPSLTTLLLDNNEHLVNLTPEAHRLKMISEVHVDEDQLTGATTTTRLACSSKSSLRYADYEEVVLPNPSISISISDTNMPGHIHQHEDTAHRRQLLQVTNAANTPRIRRNHDKETVSPSLSSMPSSLAPDSENFSKSPIFQPPINSPSASPLPLMPPEVSPKPSPSSIFLPPSPLPSPEMTPPPSLSQPANPPTAVPTPPQSNWTPAPSPPFSNRGNTKSSKSKHHLIIIGATVGGFSFLIFVSAIAVSFFRNPKVVTVKPWATGLSGQLQKAFLTGVPSLKRSEVQAACEDFSNIIGSLADGTVYKGTLSSGVEIAVASTAVTSSKIWSKDMEDRFRKEIETLSKVNHKNFLNLIGYCEEQKPFTRMMVFEYAPNGTLFEHLYISEAEQLDWGVRKRIAMGIAYCLEHIHQLTPPIAHRNLLSSSIYLTEDYAAKVSYLSFWNDIAPAKKCPEASELWETPSIYTQGDVYSFGVILFELITGRIPHTLDYGNHADWASEYLQRGQPLRDLMDLTLNTWQTEEIEKWSEVIKDCVHPNPEQRPAMREVIKRLKEITAIGPDGAIPRLSPLWWAELEIESTDTF